MSDRPSIPPGRESLTDALLHAAELRRLVEEQHEIDRELAAWRARMERLFEPRPKEKR